MDSLNSGSFVDLFLYYLETECPKKLSFSPLFSYRNVNDIITCVSNNKIEPMLIYSIIMNKGCISITVFTYCKIYNEKAYWKL